MKTAKKPGIETNLIELESVDSVQQAPCAFGTFCIIKEGKIISHHPISNARFENIMKQS